MHNDSSIRIAPEDVAARKKCLFFAQNRRFVHSVEIHDAAKTAKTKSEVDNIG